MESQEMTAPLRQILEAQRLDRHYAQVARNGHDPSTGERGTVLQSYAAKRSRQTRTRLMALIGDGV